MVGTRHHQVGDETQPEAAEAAGHQIGCFRIKEGPRVGDRKLSDASTRRCLQNQLPLMLTVDHHAQRSGVLAVGEDGGGYGRHRTLGQQVQAGQGQFPRQLRVVQHQTVHVNGGEPEVFAENAQVKFIVGVDVHLADFAMPAARPQGLQAEGNVTAGQGVEHHVNTFPCGGCHQVVCPVKAV